MDAQDNAAAITQMARALGIAIPEAELRALAPQIAAVWAALGGLRALPLEGREPAFRPPTRTDAADGDVA
jgi:hypothetical protein